MKPRTFTNWRTSSRSGGGDNCVEFAVAADGRVGLRDSKDPTGPILAFAPTEWSAFTKRLRKGVLDR